MCFDCWDFQDLIVKSSAFAKAHFKIIIADIFNMRFRASNLDEFIEHVEGCEDKHAEFEWQQRNDVTISWCDQKVQMYDLSDLYLQGH